MFLLLNLEYAGILLQMKMRASASLMPHKKPPSPKIINNLNNEVHFGEAVIHDGHSS